jgi:hypothetical protein
MLVMNFTSSCAFVGGCTNCKNTCMRGDESREIRGVYFIFYIFFFVIFRVFLNSAYR